ncbi:MAG: 30S ribosomal protein S20 [Puniceicoccales bacterium]|jgi:small subunit ribosomal protein S20|nr:30S ribosomal protein S20 [Puniceicoccales bacterium]
MANLKSSRKDARRIVRRTARNRSTKTLLKSLDKRVRSALAIGNEILSTEAAIASISAMDKAASRGVIHKNKANRYKSSVASVVFKFGA